MYGGTPRFGEGCPDCKSQGQFTVVRELREGERLPSSELCDSCKKDIALLKATVYAGGVYWRCSDCKAEGAIKKNAFTEAVRKAHNNLTGPCGVEFGQKEGCPKCGASKEVSAA